GEPTAWTPRPDSPVNALALDAATLYAGTDDGVVAFSRASGAGTWSRAGDDTEALLADAGVLYVAGGFDTLAGKTRNGLGALDTATGVALPWNPDPALFEMPELPSSAAYALASAPGGILAGGGFRSFRGVHRRG